MDPIRIPSSPGAGSPLTITMKGSTIATIRPNSTQCDRAADALEVVIAGRIEDEDDIPAPSKLRKSEHLVALSAQLAAKVAVYRA
jgi:antitoxin (DNA-binding transcriptional repressor) of toxin-antitoxin stability system